MGREDFLAHMGSLRELFEYNLCLRVLRSLELLQASSETQLAKIVSVLEQCEYQPGEYIVQEGTLIVKDNK